MCEVCAEVGVGWLHDKLAEAQQQIAALTAERDNWQRQAVDWCESWETVSTENAALHAALQSESKGC